MYTQEQLDNRTHREVRRETVAEHNEAYEKRRLEAEDRKNNPKPVAACRNSKLSSSAAMCMAISATMQERL